MPLFHRLNSLSELSLRVFLIQVIKPRSIQILLSAHSPDLMDCNILLKCLRYCFSMKLFVRVGLKLFFVFAGKLPYRLIIITFVSRAGNDLSFVDFGNIVFNKSRRRNFRRAPPYGSSPSRPESCHCRNNDNCSHDSDFFWLCRIVIWICSCLNTFNKNIRIQHRSKSFIG